MNPTWLWCMIFFSVLLDLVCYYFVENFCIYIHQRYWPVHFLVVSLSGFSVRMRVIHRMSLGVFPLQSFEEFEDWYTFFFPYLVEFTCEAIWSFVGSFFCYRLCFISSDQSVQIISSRFIFGGLYVSKKFSISSRLPNVLT